MQTIKKHQIQIQPKLVKHKTKTIPEDVIKKCNWRRWYKIYSLWIQNKYRKGSC